MVSPVFLESFLGCGISSGEFLDTNERPAVEPMRCLAALGWAGGLLVQLLCALLAAFSMSMLAEVRGAMRASSYAEAVVNNKSYFYYY